MPTALDMIKRSMRLVGALGGGETPTADEQSDGLAALNSMLDSWSIERLSVYQTQEEQFTWTGSAGSQTMGSGGDFNTTAPAEVVGGYQRVSNIDYPIQIANEAQWAALPAKSTTSSLITWMYPAYAAPLVTLYAWPVPSANATVRIRTWKALQNFSAATTSLAMPPGYQEAIEYNLAINLADEYQRPVPPNVYRRAVGTKRTLKRQNTRVPNSRVEPALVGGTSFDYRTGD
jgi:hypothetical protein